MITIDASSSLKTAKVIEVVDCFCLLKATINSKGNDIYHKAEVDRIALKIFIWCYASVPAKIRILQFYEVFLQHSMEGKAGLQRIRIERILVLLIPQCWWRRLLKIQWIVNKINKWIEQSNLEFSLVAQRTRLKLSYYENFMKSVPSSLEKFIIVEKMERKKKKRDWL